MLFKYRDFIHINIMHKKILIIKKSQKKITKKITKKYFYIANKKMCRVI